VAASSSGGGGETQLARITIAEPPWMQGLSGAEKQAYYETLVPGPGGLGMARGAAAKAAQLFNRGHLTPDAALRAGQKWLGAGYRELASGVFRSADGLRQFRMTTLGSQGKFGPYVNFEALNPAGKVIENSHIPIFP
jgi:hypothetical protein